MFESKEHIYINPKTTLTSSFQLKYGTGYPTFVQLFVILDWQYLFFLWKKP